MVVTDSQKTKNLSDFTDIYTVTKLIDQARYMENPRVKDLADYFTSAKDGWYVNDGSIIIEHFNSIDTLRFNVDLIELLAKNIASMSLSFKVETDNVCKIGRVGITRLYSTYESLDINVNDSYYVDVPIDLSEVSRQEYISLVVDSIFEVFIEISSEIIDTAIKISDIRLTVYHEHFLQDEIDVVYNRLDLDSVKDEAIIVALGLGKFKIDSAGDLWVTLPRSVPNFFRLNDDGDLIASLNDGEENKYYIDVNGDARYEKVE